MIELIVALITSFLTMGVMSVLYGIIPFSVGRAMGQNKKGKIGFLVCSLVYFFLPFLGAYISVILGAVFVYDIMKSSKVVCENIPCEKEATDET